MQTYRDYRPDRRFQPVVAISPDGTRVAYSHNASGQYNLVVSPIGGGDERRLTSYADATVRDIRWTTDGTSLIFTADANGDEFHQVRRIPADGGEIGSLTDVADVQHYLGDPSPDGRWISYGANDREPTDQDVLIQDLDTGETRRVYADGGPVFATTWSPDSTRLLGAKLYSNTEIAILLLDVDGKPAEQLVPADGDEPSFSMPGPWLPDGSGFLLRTDAGRDFVGLAAFDLASREIRWLATPEWDVEDVTLAEDGRVVVWTVNDNGVSRLHSAALDDLLTVAVAEGAPATAVQRPAPDAPAGPIVAMSVDRDGSRAAVLISTGARPTNIAVIDLAAGTTGWLTHAVTAATFQGVEPTLVRFPTHDGRDIPAWLYLPDGRTVEEATASGPYPVVLSIHGGPEAQERPAFNYGGFYQYLLSRGIAVLAPNIRGSNGYGRAYQRLILRDWGGGDLGDFEAAARYLQASGWVDPQRIGVYGGSYGGFATLTCMSRLPQYFACGVDLVGPSNLVTLAKSVPPTWRSMIAAWVGDPETEADFLLSRSPITYADQIGAPLFVIQGANDPRVKKAESDGIVEALRARGVEVRYDVYEDEGHGFTRWENEAKALGDSAEFLIEHLGA
jgi:dipeptidyl aminopeptidase/acylaminoacyl peptidase